MRNEKSLVLVMMVLALAMGFAGCTHNLTTLEEAGITARTSTASLGTLNPDGKMEAAVHGTGYTQTLLDAEGQFTNMSMPSGVVGAPIFGGKYAYVLSPKDMEIEGLNVKQGTDGAVDIKIASMKVNMSAPLEKQVAALTTDLAALQSMTKEEALATVEKWKAAGEMLPTVADLLKTLISAAWPAAVVTP